MVETTGNDELRRRLAAAEDAVAALQSELGELRLLAAAPAIAPEPVAEELPWWEYTEPVWANPEAEATPPAAPPPAPVRSRQPDFVVAKPEPQRKPPFWNLDVSFSDSSARRRSRSRGRHAPRRRLLLRARGEPRLDRP